MSRNTFTPHNVRAYHVFVALLGSLCLGLLALPALAQTTVTPDNPIFGGTFRLERGNTILGELSSIGADITLAEGSVVAGRVNVMGGSLDVRGRVDGVIHVVFGELSLADTAVVEGSVYADWARVERSQGAVVTNAYEIGGAPAIHFELPAGVEPALATATRIASPGSTWGMLGRALALALFTTLATWIMPHRLRRIASEAIERPLRAGAYGLTVAITAVVAIVIFVLTLVGIPVALAIAGLVWLGAVVGIAAMAQRVGQWLRRSTDQRSSGLIYAAIGGLVVGLLLGSLEFLPILGGVVEAGVSLVGLGALVASRLGSSPSVRARQPSAGPRTA